MSAADTGQAVSADDPFEQQPGLRKFVDRVLPPPDRTVALWYAAAAAVTSIATAYLRGTVAQSMLPGNAELSLTASASLVQQPLVIAAVIVAVFALATWLVLRHTPAPRPLALFLVLSAVVSVGVRTLSALIGLPAYLHLSALADLAGPARVSSYFMGQSAPVLLDLLLIAGVVAGAWLAAVMRNPETGEPMGVGRFVLGSEEDDDATGARDSGEQAVVPPARGVGGALGWDGWHAGGAAGLALGFVAVDLVVSLVTMVLSSISNTYFTFATTSLEDNPSNGTAALVGGVTSILIVALTVYIFYRAVRRHGVSPSVWIVTAAANVGLVVSMLVFLPSQLAAISGADGPGLGGVALMIGSYVLGLFSFLIPLIGVWLATREHAVSAGSATLPAEG